MGIAVDFLNGAHSAATLRAAGVELVLVYVGVPAGDKPYVTELVAGGVGVALIRETDPNRAQQGYDAGVVDGRVVEAWCAHVGYPGDAAVFYVVSDGSATDPHTGANAIRAYARGVRSVNLARTVGWYGNRYAVDAAGAGLTWVPSTWGATDTDTLVQEANLSSPVPGTDLNTINHAFTWWGAPLPADREDETMHVYLCDGFNPLVVTADGSLCWEINAPGTLPAGTITPDQRSYLTQKIKNL